MKEPINLDEGFKDIKKAAGLLADYLWDIEFEAPMRLRAK
jgi:hypothetical protein